MFSPFKKDKRYFIKTVSFYYLCTYVSKSDKFFKFKNIDLIFGIEDWEDFWKSRPNLPPAMKTVKVPETLINIDAIVEVTPWSS